MSEIHRLIARTIGAHAAKRDVCLRYNSGDETILDRDGQDVYTYVKLPKYRVGVRVNPDEIAMMAADDREPAIMAVLDRSVGRLLGRIVRIAVDSAPIDWEFGNPTPQDDERLATWLIEQGERILARLRKNG